MNFDAFIITLDQESQRCRESLDALCQWGIRPTIVPGVRLEGYQLPAVGQGNRYANLGENGCALAHRNAITASCSSLKHALIIEDDIHINDNFRFFPQYLEFLEREVSWDLFYCYNTRHHRSVDFTILKGQVSNATHFYLVNKQSKVKVINEINRSNRPLDHLYRKAMKRGCLTLWSTPQQLVSQYVSRYGSKIQGDQALRLAIQKGHGVCL
jgi:GR25 family glycosyltransferase involved in LPS biosynthesis